MSDPKIVLRFSAYYTGKAEPNLDERLIADSKEKAIELAKQCVEKAIKSEMWEILLDLYHETKGSG